MKEFFYASRESPEYWRKVITESAPESSNSDLVSVAGGLSFLHSDFDQYKRVHLVDIDPNQIEYCKLIIHLVLNSETMEEFFDFVMLRKKYSFPENKQNDLWSLLFEGAEQTEYGYILNGVSVSERSQDIDTRATFCQSWLRDFGCFQDEASFSSLKQALSDTDFNFSVSEIQDFIVMYDFENRDAVFLLSNLDDSLHFGRRGFWQDIMETKNKAVKKVRLISDLVEIDDYWGGDNQANCMVQVSPFTKGRLVLEAKNYEGHICTQEQLQCQDLKVMRLYDLVHQRSVKDAIFLYYISSYPQRVYPETAFFLRNFMLSDAGTAIYVQKMGVFSLVSFLELYDRIKCPLSLSIRHLSYYGSQDSEWGYVVVLRKVGR